MPTELENVEGMRCGGDRHFGIFTDNETSLSRAMKKVTGLDDESAEPFTTLKIVPLQALRNHKIDGEENPEFNHCVKIGEAFYDSVLLADLLSVIGTQDVELFQKGKDNPLGLRTATESAVIAPVLIGIVETYKERLEAQALMDKVPEITYLIDEFFANKPPADKPTFSLRKYAAKRLSDNNL
jgi:hypothetical protein